MEKEITKTKEFYTPRELAEKIGMSLRFIEDNTLTRRIPGQIKIGRLWRYRIIDIEKALLKDQFLIDKKSEVSLPRRRLIKH